MSDIEFDKICFIIMPFNRKMVGDKEVDFNFIFDNVFKPAIEQVELPEGGKLIPRRTVDDYHTADISQDMFEYIEYSRFALVDITGLNANVFYELGVRHRTHESGTAIFRQEAGAPPPFDITQIKAFPYAYEPREKVSESVELVRRVLSESLERNRIDSPVARALRVQRDREREPRFANIEPLLVEADNALRHSDWTKAIGKYTEAHKAAPDNPLVLMKRGLVYRDQGVWDKAIADFDAVIRLSPDYAEAHREKGISENKAYDKKGDGRPQGMPTGEAALRRAVELKPDDFDALAALGGVLKRGGRMEEAAEMYRRATEVSHGNTYPLLNEIKIRAHVAGALALDNRQKFMLNRARPSLRSQVESSYNLPWSAFDLAEVCLYTGDSQGFLDNIDAGLGAPSAAAWQAETFRKSLELLTSAGVSLPGLDEGIQKLREAEEFLS